MSRIKDLLAEQEDIDDLKAPVRFSKGFADSAKESDLKRITGTVARWAKSMYTEDYIADNAKFEMGDDDGQPCMYLENFTSICDEIAQDLLDQLIEQEHLDLSDEEYKQVIESASALIADFYADYEDALCADAFKDWSLDNKYGDIK